MRVADVTRSPPSLFPLSLEPSRQLQPLELREAGGERARVRGRRGARDLTGFPVGPGLPRGRPCAVDEDAGGSAEEEPHPERWSQVSGNGIEVGVGQDGLCLGGLSLRPPCSASPLWAVSQSEATAGPQLDPVPPIGKRLPAALDSLKAFLLLLLLFLLLLLLFLLLLFSPSPSSPSPPPLPLVLRFPLLFPLLPCALPPLPAPPPPRPQTSEVSCCAMGRGSPRAVTSWGGETPRRDVTAGWYSTCVAGAGGGGLRQCPASPAGCPEATPHPTASLCCKSPTGNPLQLPCTPSASPAPLQHPHTANSLQEIPYSSLCTPTAPLYYKAPTTPPAPCQPPLQEDLLPCSSLHPSHKHPLHPFCTPNIENNL